MQNVNIETIASGYGLVEGPRIDGAGNLYFSDVRNGGVFRRRVDGTIETVIPRRRGVGGIAVHADGGIVVSGRNICHVRDGVTRVLLAVEGVPGFNDLCTDAQGRVYTGSMRFNPFGEGGASGEHAPGECYRIDAEGLATELYGGVALSNGMGISPDGRTLYHCDTDRRRIHVHDLHADGSVSLRAPIAVDGLADGLAVDAEGGIWVALYDGGAVQRYLPDGRPDTRIAVPAQAVTSLCFGGPDLRDLYVTSADHRADPGLGGSIFRARSPVAGLPVPPARI